MTQFDRVTQVPRPPARPEDAHKGTFGTVIVVGGSETMVGAPAMAAHSAFRTGAGLVKIAAPPDVLKHAIVIEPSATGILLRGDEGERLTAIEEGDPDGDAVLAIGPGIGRQEAAQQLVLALLYGKRIVVLDADGLNLLARTGKPRPTPRNGSHGGPPLVLTPHPGEFRRLAEPLGITASPTSPDERPQAATELAEAHRAVVVLKGHQTVVTDGHRLFINDTGNPALASAGSGDVLTGIIAALIAQGMSPFDGAVLGTHVHGRAADRWAEKHGPCGLLARDLAKLVPRVLHVLSGGRSRG